MVKLKLDQADYKVVKDIPHLVDLYMILKIQDKGHGWGQISRWSNGSNNASIHIPFVPCQSDHP